MDGHHTGHLPVVWDLPSNPGVMTNDGQCLGELFWLLPQHCRTHLVPQTCENLSGSAASFWIQEPLLLSVPVYQLNTQYQLRRRVVMRKTYLTVDNWGKEGAKHLSPFFIFSNCIPLHVQKEWTFSLPLLLPLMYFYKYFLLFFTEVATLSSSWAFVSLIFFLHDLMTSLNTFRVACTHSET